MASMDIEYCWRHSDEADGEHAQSVHALKLTTVTLPGHERHLVEARLQGRRHLLAVLCFTCMVGFYQRG